MILVQKDGVTHRLLFGTGYPSITAQASIDGMRNDNHTFGHSGLPRIPSEVIKDNQNRHALELLGIEEQT